MSFLFFVPSLLHFLVDFFSIYTLNKIGLSFEYSALLIVLYDMLAFTSQTFIGALLDKTKHLKLYMTISEILVLIATFITEPITGIIVIGIGNALFHVSAGKLILDKSEKSSPLGVFISFGAIGVGLASYVKDPTIFYMLLILFVVLALVNIELPYERIKFNYEPKKGNDKTLIIPLILIALSVTIRGFVGFYPAYTYSISNGVIYATMVIFLGKFIGGFIIDRFGKLPLIIISSVISLVSCFFISNYFVYLLSLFSINLLMALTLELTREMMPKYRAFGFGLLACMLVVGSLSGMYIKQNVSYINYLNVILILVNSIMLIYVIVISKKKERGH